MKNILFLLLLIFLFPSSIWAQSTKDLPVYLSGSLNVGYDYYNMSPNRLTRYVPNSWQVGGNLTLHLKSFAIPFSLTYGQQKITPGYPNLNQYKMIGASPKWKWIYRTRRLPQPYLLPMYMRECRR